MFKKLLQMFFFNSRRQKVIDEEIKFDDTLNNCNIKNERILTRQKKLLIILYSMNKNILS